MFCDPLCRWHSVFLRRLSGQGKTICLMMGFQVQEASSMSGAALVNTGAGKYTVSVALSFSQHHSAKENM